MRRTIAGQTIYTVRERDIFTAGRARTIDDTYELWVAARPLYGDETWKGEWLVGRHWAAIKINDEDKKHTDWLREENVRLDGHLVRFITWPQAKEAFLESLPDEYHDTFVTLLEEENSVAAENAILDWLDDASFDDENGGNRTIIEKVLQAS